MNRKTKNLLVLIVLLAIIGIAVGYAALSQTLTLNGTAKSSTSKDWNVHFVKDSAKVTTNSATYDDASITLNDGLLTGTFSATLAPGEEVVYEVSIINEGTIAAELEDIVIAGGEDANYIECDVTPATQSTTISDGSTHKYNVILTCKDTDALPETAETVEFEVTFNYVQATSSNSEV